MIYSGFEKIISLNEIFNPNILISESDIIFDIMKDFDTNFTSTPTKAILYSLSWRGGKISVKIFHIAYTCVTCHLSRFSKSDNKGKK